jgi:Tfp pilus assembly protein PilX
MSNQLKAFVIAGALAASFLTPVAASAASIIGLVDGKTLVMIDPASKKVTWKVSVKGAPTLLGIDVRPVDGMLYGVTTDGNIVTIDPKSGQATMKSKLTETVKAGGTVTVDWNPAADRLRVMSSDGTSHRINVDDGKVTVDGSHKFKDGDANAGKTPKVIAGAYSNSFKGTTGTALYNIDATTGVLVTQAPPNDGVLNTIGALGVQMNGAAAFNIVSNSADKNDAWLVTGGNLYSVDLKTGKATMAGKLSGVSGKLTDIAWMD